MANKADKAQSRGEIPIYRAWCADAGQSREKGFSDLAATDPSTAARIHAERMTDRDWNSAKIGGRGEDPYVKVTVMFELDEGPAFVTFTVIRKMQPVFEVVS